ncbi:MAG TPA: VOC family protein [Gemmatimonadaceae bacterium]|nr:VOC family protein [Gemmatimonadaceae bacterium]
MLGSADLIAFAPTRDPAKAREFYERTLGLEFISADQFALVFNCHGTNLRIADVSQVEGYKPAPFTILGWQVTNASDTVGDLVKKGVRFERFPGMDQDAAGIWKSPTGAHVAWFKDPDGNILSITQA